MGFYYVNNTKPIKMPYTLGKNSDELMLTF